MELRQEADRLKSLGAHMNQKGKPILESWMKFDTYVK